MFTNVGIAFPRLSPYFVRTVHHYPHIHPSAPPGINSPSTRPSHTSHPSKTEQLNFTIQDLSKIFNQNIPQVPERQGFHGIPPSQPHIKVYAVPHAACELSSTSSPRRVLEALKFFIYSASTPSREVVMLLAVPRQGVLEVTHRSIPTRLSPPIARSLCNRPH